MKMNGYVPGILEHFIGNVCVRQGRSVVIATAHAERHLRLRKHLFNSKQSMGLNFFFSILFFYLYVSAEKIVGVQVNGAEISNLLEFE